MIESNILSCCYSSSLFATGLAPLQSCWGWSRWWSSFLHRMGRVNTILWWWCDEDSPWNVPGQWCCTCSLASPKLNSGSSDKVPGFWHTGAFSHDSCFTQYYGRPLRRRLRPCDYAGVHQLALRFMVPVPGSKDQEPVHGGNFSSQWKAPSIQKSVFITW